MLHKPIMHPNTVKDDREELLSMSVHLFQLSQTTEIPETQSAAHLHTSSSVTPLHKFKCTQKKVAKCLSSGRWCMPTYSQTCI